MSQSEQIGMQTFDSALFKLYKEKRISLEEALKNSDSETDLKLKIKLDQKQVGSTDDLGNLSLAPKTEDEEEDGPAAPVFEMPSATPTRPG